MSPRQSLRRYLLAFGAVWTLVVVPLAAQAQRVIRCPGEEHLEIDIQQIAIQYKASGFSATLSGLSALSARLSLEPKTLQTAAAATQEWNEYVKGLVAGYNSCAITKKQYQEALQIYPRLKADAIELEKLRQQLFAQRRVDEARLTKLLEGYEGKLRAFAQLAGKEVDYDRIASVVTQVLDPLTKGQEKIGADVLRILQTVQRLERQQAETPIAKPAEVKSELRRALETKAEEAEAAYNQGYALFGRFRFAEAIPHLELALSIVKLPQFYLALGDAYRANAELAKAERVLREGLVLVGDAKDQTLEASLDSTLGRTLRDKGNLEGALRYMQHALAINQKMYGPEHPSVAARAGDIGLILKLKGDLPEALRYTQ